MKLYCKIGKQVIDTCIIICRDKKDGILKLSRAGLRFLKIYLLNPAVVCSCMQPSASGSTSGLPPCKKRPVPDSSTNFFNHSNSSDLDVLVCSCNMHAMSRNTRRMPVSNSMPLKLFQPYFNFFPQSSSPRYRSCLLSLPVPSLWDFRPAFFTYLHLFPRIYLHNSNSRILSIC